MKKLCKSIWILAFCLLFFSGAPVAYGAESITYQVRIFDTGGSGVVIRESPDMKARSFTTVPEDTVLTIDRISGGWGHTAHNGFTGWISLMFTLVEGEFENQEPEEGLIDPVYYIVAETGEEGLQLRMRPTSESSSFGTLEDGTVILAQAMEEDWVFTSYEGNGGWLCLDFLELYEEIPAKQQSTCKVAVCDTQGQGLALKEEPDINSQRFLYIPEDTELVIDQITDSGWGHTSYEGYEGWLSLRFTRIDGMYTPQVPTYGKITPVYYRIQGTQGSGLSYRIRPTVDSSTYGSIKDGTVVLVYAIEENWAYAYYDGHFGWLHMNYLQET